MKILDRYLIRQFIQTVIFGLLAFIAIFVIVDMMENLDEFLDQNVEKTLILKYYLVFVPEIVRLLLPVSLLFGGLFTMGKMSNSNELTSMKSGGISMYRTMAPIFLMTVLICIGNIYFSGYIVPQANKMKTHIERKYLNKGNVSIGNNIFFQDSRYRIVSIGYFSEDINRASRIGIQEFDSSNITKLKSRIDALSMTYDSTTKKWTLQNGSKRTFYPTNEELETFTKKTMDSLNFQPGDLVVKQKKPSEMNLTELKHTITTQSHAGNDPRIWQIEYYSRSSFALTGIIVVLFGLPFSTNKRRGGLAVQIGINILITFIYLALYKITEAFGINGALNPIITAWVVNVGFFIAAVINLVRVRQ